MYAIRFAIVLALAAFGALHCIASDPANPQSTDELRREVAELRAAVAELTKRLETLEYQKMPRAEIRSPQLAEPSNSAPSYVLPLAQAAQFPVQVHDSASPPAPTTKQTLPPYLRFSEKIERAMMGPF